MAALLSDPVLAYLPLSSLLDISALSKTHYRAVCDHVKTKTQLVIPQDTCNVTRLDDLVPSASKVTLHFDQLNGLDFFDIPVTTRHLTVVLQNRFFQIGRTLSRTYCQNLRLLTILFNIIEQKQIQLESLEIKLAPQTEVTQKYRTWGWDKSGGEYDYTYEYDDLVIDSIDPINFWWLCENHQEVGEMCDLLYQKISEQNNLQTLVYPSGLPYSEDMRSLAPHVILSSNEWITEEEIWKVLMDAFH